MQKNLGLHMAGDIYWLPQVEIQQTTNVIFVCIIVFIQYLNCRFLYGFIVFIQSYLAIVICRTCRNIITCVLNLLIKIIVQDGEAKGVRLKNGKVIKARNAVVSNATIWDTVPMLPDAEVLKAQQLDRSVEWKEEMSEIPALGSILHLFLGIDATG